MIAGQELPAGTRFVDCFVFDLNGTARGKRLPVADWLQAQAGGIAFSASALLLDAQGNAQGPLGYGVDDGDPDASGRAVPGQIWAVPWAAEAVAQSLLTMRDHAGPLWFDAREVLARVVERCEADGLHPVVACELEFYLVDVDERGRPRPPGGPRSVTAGHLCLQRVEEHGAFLHRLHDALAQQGIEAGTLVSEYGPGQFEINLRHGTDPLLAADQAALMRRATIGVAASMGQQATFMAKPYPEHPGNGLHVHASLVDASGENLFGSAGGQVLLEQAIAGIQALQAESMAFFAPSFSAYRRYRPGAFVATDGAWGENDRRAAFRIPTGSRASRRVEHRVACADASPHLVMACVLAGLHHGVTGKLVPGDYGPTPKNILDALTGLEGSARLAAYLPPRFPALFCALKRAEFANLFAQITSEEYSFYL